MKKYLLLFSLFFVIPFASAEIIGSCGGNLNASGYYELSSDITGTGTCLTVTSSNVEINCNGHNILYGSDGVNGRIGINAVLGVVPLNNLTVKNCLIRDINASGTTGYGIMLTRFSNSYLYNNTINTNGTATNHGIFLTTDSNNNLIENNTVNAIGTTTGNFGIHLISSSDRNIIRGNTVSGIGTTTSYALHISTSSDENTIVNNSFFTNSTGATSNGFTVHILGSVKNNLTGNYIHNHGVGTNYGVYLVTSAHNNTVKNNLIISNGTAASNVGVHSLDSDFNKISGNLIYTYGTSTNYGILIQRAQSNFVSDNIVYTSGSTTTNYGIYLTSAVTSNTIINNTISTYGTSANAGIALSGAQSNFIINNSVSARGTTTTNYGIYLTQSQFNEIIGNNASTNGTTTNYGIYLLTNVQNNLIKNNIISTHGTTTNYGVFLSSASLNNIIGNNITANGSTASGTTNNWGIHISVNSEANQISNNTVYTDGGGLNYGLSLITSSINNSYLGNRVYPAGNGASNIGAYVSESHSNLFQNNIFSTYGTATDYGFYLHSSSRNNLIKNNNISTLGGTDSHAFHFLFITPGYPQDNIISSNNLLGIAGRDLSFGTASINGTTLVNQPLGNYSFTGLGGLVNVKNESAGEIGFLTFINGTNISFSDKVFITNNFARIDEFTRELNKSAEITLYNIPTASVELQILRNGLVCGAICTNLTSMQAENVTFNVTAGGNYSIDSASELPFVELSLPVNGFNSSSNDLSFNFTASDDVSLTLSCKLYIDSLLNQTNNSVISGTLTNFFVYNIAEGNHSWYVRCFDGANNTDVSEVRVFNVNSSTPTTSLNYPANNSYLNNVNSVLLNYTVYDGSLENMTVWLYGNGALLNVSYNITNGTSLQYNWTGLILRQYNWTVITNNGFANYSNIAYFNIMNLSINCEAGGPYQTGALVLSQGNISDGIAGLSSQTINASIYKDGILNTSKTLVSLSDGSFQTTFSSLGPGDYVLNTSASYQAHNKSCVDSFTIGTVLTPASFVLDKVASFYNITNETISYNITLRLTNKGGSNATFSNISDADSSSSPYNIGTVASNDLVSRSYIRVFTRNSTAYYPSLSIARSNGIDSYTSSLVEANSTQVNLAILPMQTEQQLTLIKNIYFNSENLTAVNYTLSIEVINSGGIDLNGIVINDQNLNLTTTQSINQSESYTYSGSLVINKEATNLEYSFFKTTATVNSVQYDSNQLNIVIPGYGGPADTIVYAPSSVSASASFSSVVQIINQNPDIGQNFVLDYWITNNDETVNYTSGQMTLYVGASSSLNTTLSLTSPSSAGIYKLRALVSYTGGPDVAFDSFEVEASSQASSGSSGGSGGGGTSTITGRAIQDVTEDIICNSPYIRYGRECCLDTDQNNICDRDEILEDEISDKTSDIPEKEEINRESRIFKSIKEGFSNFGAFFSLVGHAIIGSHSYLNLKYLYVFLWLLIAIGIAFFLIRHLRKDSLPRAIGRLGSAKGTEVYSEKGIYIGVIKDVYVDNEKSGIHGWLIKVNDDIAEKIRKKNILVSQKHVRAIRDIMIIDEYAYNFLESYNSSGSFR